jgi:hypothetical protein
MLDNIAKYKDSAVNPLPDSYLESSNNLPASRDTGQDTIK